MTHVAGSIERALAGPSPPSGHACAGKTYRELSDLRAEFQRSMSQPRALGGQATAWWPAVAALDQVMDTVTRAAIAVNHGAPAPSADDVRRLVAAPGRQVADAVRNGAHSVGQGGSAGHGAGRRWPRSPTRSAACRPPPPRRTIPGVSGRRRSGIDCRGAPVLSLCQIAAVRARMRFTMRTQTSAGVCPPCRSRSSWPLKVSLTDSMTCRSGLKRWLLTWFLLRRWFHPTGL